MIRKIGIALIAVFALSAVAAGTATAGETYTVEGISAGAKSFLTGHKTSNHEFSTPSGTVTCTTVGFPGEAVQTGPSVHEITVNPSYSTCTAFGFSAHVTNNGCHYLFTTPTDLGGGKWTIHPPHIVPTSGSSCNFKITPTFLGASVCTQTVPNQTPTSGHIIATNAGGGAVPMDVNLETTVTGIHYTGTGGVCGDGTTHSDGAYKGNVTITCFSDAAHTKPVGCTLS